MAPLESVWLRRLQESRVATREESGVLGFPSRRGLTPRGITAALKILVVTIAKLFITS